MFIFTDNHSYSKQVALEIPNPVQEKKKEGTPVTGSEGFYASINNMHKILSLESLTLSVSVKNIKC